MDFSKLSFKNGNSQPLYAQLLEKLETAIESGELAIGVRLPSERALAEQLRISRTTVMNAYRELEARGLVHSYVGRGTFVCAGPEPAGAPFAWRGKVSRAASLHNDPALRHLIRDTSRPDLISFAAGSPAIDIFPVKVWQRLTEQALRDKSEEVLSNGPTAGLPCLRQAIARRVGTKPERILILSGSQQGLDLISRCLLDPGDAVIVDRPCYVGAIQNFRAAGAHLIGWDIVRADLDELEDLILRHRPKLIFTNPTFQNPTGRVLSLRERRELLKLAARYRVPILEDDPYRETYFDGAPPPSLRELDEYNIVIYLSTFSKVLAPGLRLGWLTAAEYVVDQLALIKQRENLFTEGIGQYALAEFLQSGLFDDHLGRLRTEHARRQQKFLTSLKRHLPAKLLKFSVPPGGLYLWCRVGHGLNPWQWSQQALAAGVAFTSGEIFYADAVSSQEARFCYTWLPADKIEEGVRRLAETVRAGNHLPAHEGSEVPLV
ncbi:MAG TPA: PLP-dependent aminotransferase family protein [Blastocatellia bacterium]|nr:PLP-dependent aminotransferase family protein [Blastocatellia bacterium]